MNFDSVWKIRTYVILLGIVFFFVITAIKCAGASENDQEAFWPPDMVPHPVLPEPDPSDNNA